MHRLELDSLQLIGSAFAAAVRKHILEKYGLDISPKVGLNHYENKVFLKFKEFDEDISIEAYNASPETLIEQVDKSYYFSNLRNSRRAKEFGLKARARFGRPKKSIGDLR